MPFDNTLGPAAQARPTGGQQQSPYTQSLEWNPRHTLLLGLEMQELYAEEPMVEVPMVSRFLAKSKMLLGFQAKTQIQAKSIKIPSNPSKTKRNPSKLLKSQGTYS